MTTPGVPGPLALLQTVRDRFEPARPGRGPLRVGLESEVIPVSMEDGSPVPPVTAGGGLETLPVLEEVAGRRGWCAEDTAGGVPRFLLPGGGVLSYEPGGQLEYASPPVASLLALDRGVRETWDQVGSALSAAGIRLLARGVDPATPVEDAQLVLAGERYPRQRRHYDRIGPDGRVMMLQTAALHVNLDFGPEAVGAWNAANALAPVLMAIFANAPARYGAAVAHRSHRAALWRTLDPGRSGVFPAEGDPTPRYLAFALGADAFLMGEADAPSKPFRDWLKAGATLDDFKAHLTTLFPEVRPRGYLEIRSVDALPARWAVVPAAVALGVLHHLPTRAKSMRVLPAPTEELLERAGRLGLDDEELGRVAQELAPRILEGLHGVGPELAPPGIIRRVEDFLAEYTAEGRDPGAAATSRVED